MTSRWALCTLSVLVALAAASAPVAETMPARLYEVVTETGMPHLEESLRYSTTRENRCLAGRDLATAFPILGHASLADCKLRHENRQGDTVTYRLVCDGGHGTTGSATWRLGEQSLQGTLEVKLGGKNMTFYQRLTARSLGRCSSEASQAAILSQ